MNKWGTPQNPSGWAKPPKRHRSNRVQFFGPEDWLEMYRDQHRRTLWDKAFDALEAAFEAWTRWTDRRVPPEKEPHA